MIPNIQLAPMEGVLDHVLRELLSEVGGFDRMVTEFVRVTERLQPDHVFRKYCPELETGGQTKFGTPVFIQLLGGRPEWLAENAARAVALGAPGIDLNFGCPAKTVNRHDGGATLLKNPERVMHVTHAVRKAVPKNIPVTAKVRLGFDHKEYHREIAQAAEEGGATHLVVHARTKVEMYQRPAHWDYIRRMKQNRQIPILANGDIWSVDDYEKCRAAAGVDRVALGRGVVRRPTLAQEIRNPQFQVESFDDVDFLNRFAEGSLHARGEAFAIARIKQLLRYWSENGERHALWFHRAKTFKRFSEVQDFLKEIRKRDLCPKFKSTHGPIAPTASEPKIFLSNGL